MLFHGGQKTQLVPGGEKLQARCPHCGEDAVFREVEITTSAGVFFVDLMEDKERKFRCSSCGEICDRVSPAAAAAAAARPAPAPPVRPARDLAAELEAERAQRAREKTKRDQQVDDELAALKRRLGK